MRRRHTCLQQARNATDGFHDSTLRPEERFGPRRARCYGSSLPTNGADYAESGQGAGSGLGRGSVHELGRSRWHVDGSGGGVRRGTGSAADWPTRDLYSSCCVLLHPHLPNQETDDRNAHGSRESFKKPSAMPLTPTVLHPLTLPGLLHYVLSTQTSASPTLLIVCSSQDQFLQNLATSLQRDHGEDATNSLEQLVAPTLHNLLSTRHVKLAFCASVQALLAYLTSYGRPGTGLADGAGGRERMVLVNPLTLHAPSPSFSAQGLSRTFATAAEVALEKGIDLHVVECEGQCGQCVEQNGEDAEMERELEGNQAENVIQDPWEQAVSILNVSARRFGSGSGERAWAGRTITAKRIAGRWFRFHRLEHDDLG